MILLLGIVAGVLLGWRLAPLVDIWMARSRRAQEHAGLIAKSMIFGAAILLGVMLATGHG